MQRMHGYEAGDLRVIAAGAQAEQAKEAALLRAVQKKSAVQHVEWLYDKRMEPLAREGKFTFAGYTLPDPYDRELFEEALKERGYIINRRGRIYDISWATPSNLVQELMGGAYGPDE